jgi:tRNA C32,U32 (ribose-2'-O)-methylase TrmJ
MKTILPFLLSAVDLNSNFEEMDDKTASGIDKLELMLRFISILESEKGQTSIEFGKLKSWLYRQLKRKITSEEEVSLLTGIANYIYSAPATPERMNAMNYIFEAKFINNVKNEEK